MRKVPIHIIFANILLVCGYTLANAENEKLVTVQAQVLNYRAESIRLDFENNVSEWKDSINIKILFPKVWKGRKIEIFCSNEPENSPWRNTGNIYEFSIPEKYLIGSNAGGNIKYTPNLGDIVGKIKVIENAVK